MQCSDLGPFSQFPSWHGLMIDTDEKLQLSLALCSVLSELRFKRQPSTVMHLVSSDTRVLTLYRYSWHVFGCPIHHRDWDVSFSMKTISGCSG
jgi:hypothetical protein